MNHGIWSSTGYHRIGTFGIIMAEIRTTVFFLTLTNTKPVLSSSPSGDNAFLVKMYSTHFCQYPGLAPKIFLNCSQQCISLKLKYYDVTQLRGKCKTGFHLARKISTAIVFTPQKFDKNLPELFTGSWRAAIRCKHVHMIVYCLPAYHTAYRSLHFQYFR